MAFRFISTTLFSLALLVSFAAAQEAPKPLGIPLGAPLEQARKELPGKALRDLGINRYSDGPAFETDGRDLGVEGLKGVLLVFDTNKRLTALQMTLGKGDFERILGHLRKQYPLTSSKLPFVGDREAIFEAKDFRIELSAPHMGFDSSLVYMTKAFFEAVQQRLEAERKAKLKSEGARF